MEDSEGRLQSVMAEKPWVKDTKPSRKESPGGFSIWEDKDGNGACP
jgi:hypothetical protein